MVEYSRFAQSLRTYDLGQALNGKTPPLGVQPRFTRTFFARHGDFPRPSGATSAADLLVMTTHTGTHVDALGHYAFEGKLYGGVDAQEAQVGMGGLRANGVENIPPTLCRGVVLDIAGALGRPVLSGGHGITPAELQAAAERQAVDVGRGDVVLVRTGWATYWGTEEYIAEALPGITLDAACWLADRGVAMVGSDTLALEVSPAEAFTIVHVELLVRRGIPIMENLNLESLVADRVHEFLFVIIPLNITGATASPVRPLAVIW